jgi:hypothetical protein
MNAQRSFDPREHAPQRRKSAVTAPRQRSRIKPKLAYIHRRQGLEAATKLVTYSALSVFGMVTLVNSIGDYWSQQDKLHHLKTESQDTKLRVEKINSSFNRSFDPQQQKNVMQENSYKIAPDRRQIVLIIPPVDVLPKVIGK